MRQLRIRELLESQEFVDLESLSTQLDASESTVRRDLTALEEEGILKRVHGGALAIQPRRDHLLDFDWQRTRMEAEKRRIAKLAAPLVESGQTVILDGGSTVAALARELVGRSLRVVTNSLPIAEILSDSRETEVTLTGGYLYPQLRVTLGSLAEQMLSRVSADVLIMGIGGITEAGFSNNNTLLVGLEHKMIEVSRKVIIVADHTKFDRTAMVHLAPLNAADILVTDTEASPKHRELLLRHGVEVLLA